MVHPRVFMDFTVNHEPCGRVIFELFNDTAPKTCENFRALCTGEKGVSANGNPLYYKNSVIHRSIKGFMVQGGDFTKRNGIGGESIYGSTFSDEDLQRPLDSPALLCMANKGPNTNGSQFFITLRECPHLNGKHVVFGRVIRGYDEVIQRLAETPVDEKDRPTLPIIISNCGELELKKHKKINDDSRLEDSHRPRKARSKRRPSGSSSHDRNGRREKKPRLLSGSGLDGKDEEPAVKGETEEEYDARLEREEMERLESERRSVLAHVKETYSAGSSQNGIRYKGRGRMKYVDPENQRGRS